MMVHEISIDELTQKALKKALELGLNVTSTGSIIVNESMTYHILSKALEEYGIIYTSIKEGFERYPDIIERFGQKLVNVDPKYVDNGILLYIPKNVRIVDPIYTCLVLGDKGFKQRIYNLYVIDDGSEVIASKGCLSLVSEGAHISITEIHVGKGSRLHSIMIHNWMPGVTVSSITKVKINDNGILHTYYINLTSVKKINYGTVIYIGRGGKVRSDMIVVGRGSSELNYWSEAYLEGEDSSAELISRMIGSDRSRVDMRAKIVSKARRSRGHIECQGLQLSKDSKLSTSPTLESYVNDSILTHEASIGKISEEELEYLMARGFSEEEAVSMIVRGFIGVGLDLIPDKLKPLVENVLDMLSKSVM